MWVVTFTSEQSIQCLQLLNTKKRRILQLENQIKNTTEVKSPIPPNIFTPDNLDSGKNQSNAKPKSRSITNSKPKVTASCEAKAKARTRAKYKASSKSKPVSPTMSPESPGSEFAETPARTHVQSERLRDEMSPVIDVNKSDLFSGWASSDEEGI